MISRIEKAFAQARAQDRAALIPYLTGGFPDPRSWTETVVALDRAGADLIEIGLPFSDPLADGPVIQEASRRVLEAGLTTAGLMELIASVRDRVKSPLIIMTYYNPILAQGLDSFAAMAARAGVAGLIIPDLPPEEAGDWLAAAGRAGLETVFLVAPTTPPRRLGIIDRLGQGFVYLVSMTGVTGSGLDLSPGLADYLDRVRSACRLPTAVGFGIDSPAKAAALGKSADGVVVGSALIKAIMERPGPAAETAGRFLAEFAKALAETNGRAKEGRSA